MTNFSQNGFLDAFKRPSKGVVHDAVVIAFRDDGRVLVLDSPKGRPPKISFTRDKKSLTASVSLGMIPLADTGSNQEAHSGQSQGELNMNPDQNNAGNNTGKPGKPAKGQPAGDEKAAKVALPIPDTDIDISAEAKLKLEEYQKTIFNQTMKDKVAAAFNDPNASPVSFASLIVALVDKNGQTALDVLGAVKLADLMPRKPAAGDGEGSGAAGRVREKAVNLTDEQRLALTASVTDRLGKDDAKDGLTVTELVKTVGFNSPTVKLVIDALKAAGKLVQLGESRSTRYKLAPTNQPALPGTDASPAASA
jgi:hypothetical protein